MTGMPGRVFIRDDLHRRVFAVRVARTIGVAGIESNTAVVTQGTQQPQKRTATATDFDDGLLMDSVTLHEVQR